MDEQHLDIVIPDTLRGKRLDQALAVLLPQHSRARLQGWIREGQVTVDGHVPSQRDRIKGGERVALRVSWPEAQHDAAEAIPLDIVHEDAELLLLNKPPGLVVHPGAGNPAHTLLNALLHHDPALARVPRCGIIQRLDKDTSGIMVIARTPVAHTWLTGQMRRRLIKREYDAIVSGELTAGGTVDAPLGRHAVQRTRMAVSEGGRVAVTHYRILKRFRACTWLRVQLETGRTHQIRVHMSHIHHPVLGDRLYGGVTRLPRGLTERLRHAIRDFGRQALHATALTLVPPGETRARTWKVPLPADMRGLLELIEAEQDGHAKR